MKTLAFHSILVLFVALVCVGCASSERMTRLSGGFISSYSPPEKQRIRSDKYRAIERNSLGSRYGVALPKSKDRNAAPTAFQLNENLLNLWPFFFRSGNYSSILWPFMDADPYGFAVRPFYNHEGDDYSILFPLSSWNTESGFGWCLIGVWGKDGWAILPLFAWTPDLAGIPLCFKWGTESNGYFFGTPLFIHSWEHRTLSTANPYSGSTSFTECLLAYHGTRQTKNYGDWDFLFNRTWNLASQADKNILAYRLAQKSLPLPDNSEQLNALKKKIFDGTKPQAVTYSGLFPFFHSSSSEHRKSFSILGHLFHFSKSALKTRWDLCFWLLAGYNSNTFSNPFAYTKNATSFWSFPLMSLFSSTQEYVETKERKALRNLNSLSFDYAKNKAEIQKLWEKDFPQVPLPDTVKDGETMRLFLQDFAKNRTYPTETSHSGFCLPLFWYSFSPKKSAWFIPLLLTGSRVSADSSGFLCLPLLSWATHDKYGDFSTFGTPLAWYSKNKHINREGHQVFSRNTFCVSKGRDCIELQDTHAALWLFYHGKSSFMIAKEGLSEQDINSAVYFLQNTTEKKRDIVSSRNALEQRKQRCGQWKTTNKIEEYQKLIELEYIRMDAEKLDKKQKELEKEIALYTGVFKRLKIDIALNDNISKETCKEKIREILEQCTDIRSFEDHGSGLFYHSETYENGDGYWSFLFGLAGEKRNGDAYEKHILHFLYKDIRQGDKREKLIFPFISIQQNGNNSRTSFLGRIWQKNVSDGKTNGYFLFIPYGEK